MNLSPADFVILRFLTSYSSFSHRTPFFFPLVQQDVPEKAKGNSYSFSLKISASVLLDSHRGTPFTIHHRRSKSIGPHRSRTLKAGRPNVINGVDFVTSPFTVHLNIHFALKLNWKILAQPFPPVLYIYIYIYVPSLLTWVVIFKHVEALFDEVIQFVVFNDCLQLEGCQKSENHPHLLETVIDNHLR